MELFEREIDSTANLLPKDGTVNYYGKIFSPEEADYYYQLLLSEIEWRNDEAIIFGKNSDQTKSSWYGDIPFEYTYSNATKTALPWTENLLILKNC